MSRVSAARTQVLVVDDEQDIAGLIKHSLEKGGDINVDIVGTGDEALKAVNERTPDLIVLDLNLPVLSGLEVCRILRARASTARVPIIMLTARTSESDRVTGLDVGADDYITKPFSTAELVARVRALLRRSSGTVTERVLEIGDLHIDPSRRAVERAGQALALTTLEFDLLYFMASRAGRVFTREALMEHVWGSDRVVDGRSIDSLVSRLRRKIEPDAAHPFHLQTVWGSGYRFADARS
jgi:DNA-binding response OmpR family regulator